MRAFSVISTYAAMFGAERNAEMRAAYTPPYASTYINPSDAGKQRAPPFTFFTSLLPFPEEVADYLSVLVE